MATFPGWPMRRRTPATWPRLSRRRPARASCTALLPWPDLLALLQSARQRARAVWVLADCCRAAPGMERARQATGDDLRRGVDEDGNLVICTASAGDRPSYESDELRHGLFSQAWLEALRGEVGPGYDIAY